MANEHLMIRRIYHESYAWVGQCKLVPLVANPASVEPWLCLQCSLVAHCRLGAMVGSPSLGSLPYCEASVVLKELSCKEKAGNCIRTSSAHCLLCNCYAVGGLVHSYCMTLLQLLLSTAAQMYACSVAIDLHATASHGLA